tara:strand:- start:4122 stop:5327 length:1206 start_codon:yes stop_codon:yes gene_type:complete
MKKITVPYGSTVHGEEEIQAVVNVLKTSTQMGKNVKKFESQVANLFGKKYGVMVNSGTSALLLAIEILEIEPGSEVITPSCTFGTTVGSILKNGLIPSYVDVEEGTYCIDVDKIEPLITEKTKAMVVPNLLGNIAKWDKIKNLAKKYNLKLIEDSADTIGGQYQGKKTGEFSDISICSFYGSHVINCAGNGGILCMDDKTLHKNALLLRSWGRSSSLFDPNSSEETENRFNVELDGVSYDSKFLFTKVGYQLEPSEMGAAFGLVQLKKLSSNIKKREDIFLKHINFFENYRRFFILPLQTENSITGWLAFPLMVKDTAPFSRKEFMTFLEKNNIQTRVVMAGNIIRQPGFKDQPMKRLDLINYAVSDKILKGGILIGCHHGLADDQVNHIYDVCMKFLDKY